METTWRRRHPGLSTRVDVIVGGAVILSLLVPFWMDRASDRERRHEQCMEAVEARRNFRDVLIRLDAVSRGLVDSVDAEPGNETVARMYDVLDQTLAANLAEYPERDPDDC